MHQSSSVIVGQLGDVRISEGDQFFAVYEKSSKQSSGISSIASECHYGESDQAWRSRLLVSTYLFVRCNNHKCVCTSVKR